MTKYKSMLIRTTLRIREDLKNNAELKAFREDITLQDIFNTALEVYLKQEGKKEAKKLVFKTHDLGKPLDNLRRSDYYSEP